MTIKLKYLLLPLLLSFLLIITGGCTQNSDPVIKSAEVIKNTDSLSADLSQYVSSEHLINPEQLFLWQQDPDIDCVLIDVRKRKAYEEGHIKGAKQIWRPDIISKNYPYGGMRLEKDKMETLMQQLAVNDNSKIVLYDAKGNPDAARVWFLLSIYGYQKVCILNGGITNIGLDKINTEIPEPKTGNFVFNNKTNAILLANKSDVSAAIADSNTILLDCRTKEEYTGEKRKKGAFRAGHIPTAVNIDYSEAIAYEKASVFRDLKDLKQRFSLLPKDKNIIVYCQSGVRSALLTFVLKELMGYPSVSNYDGSWIEWSYDKELPVVNDFNKPEES